MAVERIGIHWQHEQDRLACYCRIQRLLAYIQAWVVTFLQQLLYWQCFTSAKICMSELNGRCGRESSRLINLRGQTYTAAVLNITPVEELNSSFAHF